MSEPKPALFSRPAVLLGLAAAGAAAATVLVLALNASIASHKAEARQTFTRLVDLDETTVDPALWGKNFPRQVPTATSAPPNATAPSTAAAAARPSLPRRSTRTRA